MVARLAVRVLHHHAPSLTRADRRYRRSALGWSHITRLSRERAPSGLAAARSGPRPDAGWPVVLVLASGAARGLVIVEIGCMLVACSRSLWSAPSAAIGRDCHLDPHGRGPIL